MKYNLFTFLVVGFVMWQGDCGRDENQADNDVKNCSLAKLDLVIILDSSGSVGKENFRTMMKSVQSLIDQLPVQSNGIRVSVIGYATHADVITFLDEDMEKAQKKAKLRTMAYYPGSTFTHKALQQARRAVLTNYRGDRPDVPDLILLVTDGVSVNQKLTRREAQLLKERPDVKILVIGIGRRVADDELLAVASGPQMVHHVASFGRLVNIVGSLASFTCSDIIHAPETADPTMSPSASASDILANTNSVLGTRRPSSRVFKTRRPPVNQSLKTPASTTTPASKYMYNNVQQDKVESRESSSVVAPTSPQLSSTSPQSSPTSLQLSPTSSSAVLHSSSSLLSNTPITSIILSSPHTFSPLKTIPTTASSSTSGHDSSLQPPTTDSQSTIESTTEITSVSGVTSYISVSEDRHKMLQPTPTVISSNAEYPFSEQIPDKELFPYVKESGSKGSDSKTVSLSYLLPSSLTTAMSSDSVLPSTTTSPSAISTNEPGLFSISVQDVPIFHPLLSQSLYSSQASSTTEVVPSELVTLPVTSSSHLPSKTATPTLTITNTIAPTKITPSNNMVTRLEEETTKPEVMKKTPTLAPESVVLDTFSRVGQAPYADNTVNDPPKSILTPSMVSTTPSVVHSTLSSSLVSKGRSGEDDEDLTTVVYAHKKHGSDTRDAHSTEDPNLSQADLYMIIAAVCGGSILLIVSSICIAIFCKRKTAGREFTGC